MSTVSTVSLDAISSVKLSVGKPSITSLPSLSSEATSPSKLRLPVMSFTTSAALAITVFCGMPMYVAKSSVLDVIVTGVSVSSSIFNSPPVSLALTSEPARVLMSVTTLMISSVAVVVPATSPKSASVPELSVESLSATVMSTLVPVSLSLSLLPNPLPPSASVATIS